MSSHTGSIESELGGSGLFASDSYKAACICGWKGPIRKTKEEAKYDLGQHYDEMESEP